MKKVAIIGIQGVPASYGGFESLVENIIGDNQSPDIAYTIYCSSKDMDTRLKVYKEARLKYLPLHANGVQCVPYDMWSLLRSIRGYDVVLVLGVSGCLFLPIFRMFYRKKLIINIDGLEHRREKWGKLARKVLLYSERAAVRYADTIIADNKGIQDYVTETYHRDSVLIAYGGDHVRHEMSQEVQEQHLAAYQLEKGKYAITVCRIEPENNCHKTLEAFANSGKELVFIGNWNKSAYGRNLKEKYSNYPHLHLLDAIYDLDILYALRKNAGAYVHGHSAGGTNPSLVEAMFFGCPILSYDVVYNRATTHNQAYYWKEVADLEQLLTRTDLDGKVMTDIAQKEYTWKHIARQYESLY